MNRISDSSDAWQQVAKSLPAPLSRSGSHRSLLRRKRHSVNKGSVHETFTPKLQENSQTDNLVNKNPIKL